jgi:anti-sigma regulatory factor (Ser/Thr protein kinase)
MQASRSEARRLSLRKNIDELPRLAQWIEAWTEQAASPGVAFAIALCVEEAVANIIMHSTAANDRLDITVELKRNGNVLTAQIEDNGRAFDPTGVPSPSPAASIEDAKVGDLGIHLMRSFANGMHYEHRDGRNRLMLRFLEKQAERVG